MADDPHHFTKLFPEAANYFWKEIGNTFFPIQVPTYTDLGMLRAVTVPRQQ